MNGGVIVDPAGARTRYAGRVALAAAGVAFAALLAYAPALSNGFVNWDDDRYVTGNPAVRQLTWDGVRWAFTTLYESNWHPLTWLSHMLDGSLFGTNPAGHHAMSIVLHAANAALLFLVLLRMTGGLAPSALAAALFALHPLNVESVAWISERKNVLSTLFWILTIGAYARYAERPSRGRYTWVLVLFALGLMAKPMLVTLPFVLLLLDDWPLRRLNGPGRGASPRDLIVEKLPLFAMSLASCVVTLIAQRPARVSMTLVPFGDRLANAAVAYLRYLAKAIVPIDLSPYYSLPGTPEEPAVALPVAVLAAAALAALTLLAWRFRRRAPHALVGWLWFLGTLVPVIGIVQVGGQAMADRYAYVPLIGVFIAVAWSLPLARVPAIHAGRAPIAGPARAAAGAAIFACVVLVALGVATARQTRVWRDSPALWQHVLAKQPRSRLALTNYGIDLVYSGRAEEGIALFERALAIDPDFEHARVSLGGALTRGRRYDEALRHLEPVVANGTQLREGPFNLGVTLALVGRRDEARRALERALEIDPRYADALSQLGLLLAQEGRYEDATAYYRRALAATPDHAEARVNLGAALSALGRKEEAIAEYASALARAPDDASAHYNMANALADLGRLDEAVEHYREAAALDTTNAEVHFNLSIALVQKGDLEGAARAAHDAIRVDPSHAGAHYNLGLVLSNRGDNEAALREFEEASRLRPGYAEAYVNQGVVLTALGRTSEAIERYQRAIEAQPANVSARQNLAYLLLRLGRHREASAAFREALRMAPNDAAMSNGLAWVLATARDASLRDGAEAVALAERVVSATGRRDANALDTLGAALAESRRYDEARAAAEEALAVARASGDSTLAVEIGGRAALYARRQPYRMAG
jgi:protein O-mannosyl-transferase